MLRHLFFVVLITCQFQIITCHIGSNYQKLKYFLFFEGWNVYGNRVRSRLREMINLIGFEKGINDERI